MVIAAAKKDSGLGLIEMLVYISLWFVVVSLSLAAFFRVLHHTQTIRRLTTDIARVLHAGEKWRHDVRLATAMPELLQDEATQTLEIPQETNRVAYRFAQGTVYRRTGPNASWRPLLPGVKTSELFFDRAAHAGSWRWELELITKQKNARVRPLFTFRAATPPGEAR